MWLVLALSSIVPAADAEGGVKFFQGSFDAALKEASAKSRPVFVDFYTEW